MRTDAGKEFTSKLFQENLKATNIPHFTTHSEKQANYVERFIKTIKSWHTGILSEPVNVNKQNESRLWWQMYWPKDLGVKKDLHIKTETKGPKQKEVTKG